MINHRSRTNTILGLLLLSLALRTGLFAYVSQHQQVLIRDDSRSYLDTARGFLHHGVLAHPDEPERPHAYRMPLYPLFLASVMKVFQGNLLGVILVQILLDGLVTVMAYLVAERVWKGSGVIAGILVAFNLGLISYSHFILTENLFVFLFTGFLLTLVFFLDDASWWRSVCLGGLLGIMTLVRPVSMYFPILLYPFVFVALIIKQRLHYGRAAAHVALMTAISAMILTPWALRNHRAYGHYRLTAQSGEHLIQYLVPFVWQYSRQIPFLEGRSRINSEMKARADEAGIDLGKSNPFEISKFQSKLAGQILAGEPVSAVIKAWIFGMTKNLLAPAVVDFTYLLRMERPHFFSTGGATVLQRTKNFIRESGSFGLLLVLSMAAIAVLRVLQLAGLFFLAKGGRPWQASLFALIIGYFLLISGPVGYAKYRLPYEPILAVLAAIAIKEFYGRLKGKPSDAR